MRVGLFTDSLPHLSLEEVLSWLEDELPSLRDLEIGTGGYSPAPHCDLELLLADERGRERWLAALADRGFRLAALNVSGNPLESSDHDRDLRRTIDLAGKLGVARVVCMSGGRPDLSGAGWSPGIEERVDLYWQRSVLPYWQEVARSTAAGVRLCLELETGAAVYNVATFERVAAAASNLAVNLDPSHFFWQSIDPLAVVRRLGGRIGFAHGKDTLIDRERIELDGALDRRSWRFATVGNGHDLEWWRALVDELVIAGYDGVISIEYEDAAVTPEASVLAAARALTEILVTDT